VAFNVVDDQSSIIHQSTVSARMEYPRIILNVASDILFGSRSNYNPDTDIPSLAGKVILVTGGIPPFP
jgi:hypothetical protein